MAAQGFQPKEKVNLPFEDLNGNLHGVVEEGLQIVAFVDFSNIWTFVEMHFFRSLLGFDLKGVLICLEWSDASYG